MAAVAVILVAMIALLGVFAFQVMQIVEEIMADPVDCQYDIQYGDCTNGDETCGNGTKTGTVNITTEASNGGECAYEDGETVTEACNLGSCSSGEELTEGPTALVAFDVKDNTDGVCENQIEFYEGNTILRGVDFDNDDTAQERIAQECLCNEDCEGFWYEYSSGTSYNFSADVILCKDRNLNNVAKGTSMSRYMFLKNHLRSNDNDKAQICNGYTTLYDETTIDASGEETDAPGEETDAPAEPNISKFTSDKTYCKPKLSAQCSAEYLDYETWFSELSTAEQSIVSSDNAVNLSIFGGSQKYKRAKLFDETRNACGDEMDEECTGSKNFVGFYPDNMPLSTRNSLRTHEYMAGCREFGPQLGDKRDYKFFPGATDRDDLNEQAATACLKDEDCKGFFFHKYDYAPSQNPVFFCETDPEQQWTDDGTLGKTAQEKKDFMGIFDENSNYDNIAMYGIKTSADAERPDPEPAPQNYADVHYTPGGGECTTILSHNRCDASRMTFEEWKAHYYPDGDNVPVSWVPDEIYGDVMSGIIMYGSGDDPWAARANDLANNATSLTSQEKEDVRNSCVSYTTASGCRRRIPCTDDTVRLQQNYCDDDDPTYNEIPEESQYWSLSTTYPRSITPDGQKRILYYEDREYCGGLGTRDRMNETSKITGTFDSEEDLKNTAAIACSNREACQGFTYNYVPGQESEASLCPQMTEGSDNFMYKNNHCQDTLDDRFQDWDWMRSWSNSRWWCQAEGRYPNKGTDRCNYALKACNTPCAETLRTMVDDVDALQAIDFSITGGEQTTQNIYEWAENKGGNFASTLKAMCI
jgi:hypothetical protein